MPVRAERRFQEKVFDAICSTSALLDWVEYELEPAVLRDFSLTCSARYQLTECNAGKTKVRCLHLPEHEFYAKIFAATVCQALPVYERWFGPYPYAQFTIAEACYRLETATNARPWSSSTTACSTCRTWPRPTRSI